jgi:phosphatidylglycerophosphate synthase
MLTVTSLVIFVAAGIIAAQGRILAAGALLLVGGIADSLDGELARLSNTVTKFGSFLDSICDHYGDFALSLGLIWLYQSVRAETEVMLVFVALFGSMLGSQVRSRAGMVGIDTKDVGLMTRFERNLLLLLGIFTAHLRLALWALAVLNNISALQRVAHVLKRAPKRQTVQEIDIAR